MQCKKGQIPQPSRGLVKHTDDKQGGKRLCLYSASHKQMPRRHSLNAVTFHATNPLSQQANRDYTPMTQTSPTTPSPRAASPGEGTGKERQVRAKSIFPLRESLASAQPPWRSSLPKHQFSWNQETLCNSSGGRAQTSQDYVPARGRCNQSSHLKVASPILTRQQKFM